ncbi:hypothetical protein CHS0354_018503 [Potamilus streckersoni]|uniref:OmpR-like protein n=1 Tax=Potamilus streckersoni TaxID=2493646 RepID=A0AAE0TBV3_9BIVA|nr:hypothetical protein CHS0354_018503 [Potamilus streckersoni]
MEYRHLLIVEDEEKIATLIRDYAKPLFADITIISNGNRCSEYLAANPAPDLILLDLMLPGKDGIELCRSPREVIARIKAVLRRSFHEEGDGDAEIRFAHIIMNTEQHTVQANGKPVLLTPNEFGILKILISLPNKVFSRGEILQKVLGYSYEGYDRTIDTHIKNLRRKLMQAVPEKDIIKTLYGVGYKASEE